MKKLLTVLLTLALLCASAGLYGCSSPKNETVDTRHETDTANDSVGTSDTSGTETEEEIKYDYDLSEYIKMGDYMGLEVGVPTADVTEKQINDAIAELIADNTTKVTVTDRPAKEGDTLSINFVGTINDIPFQGGTANNQTITLSDNSGYIEGFATGLIGANTGDVVELHLTFPEDYDEGTFSGKDAVFKVTVNSISETVVPEFDYALVAAATEFDTTEAYLADLNNTLYEQNLESIKNLKYRTAWDAILSSVEVLQYPEKEVNELYDSNMESLLAQLESYGMSLEDYVANYTTLSDVAAFQDQYMENVRNYVMEEMAMYYIIHRENIAITEEEYNAGAQEYADRFGFESVEALTERYGKSVIHESLLLDRLFEFIIDNTVEVPNGETADSLYTTDSSAAQ